MDIKSLARKPQLVEITLDDKDLVDAYGDTITFWMKDYVDLNTYFEFFRVQNEKAGDELANLLRRLVLNKEGEPVLGPEDQLPIDITVSLLVKINETLGKSKPKSSTNTVGAQQE